MLQFAAKRRKTRQFAAKLRKKPLFAAKRHKKPQFTTKCRKTPQNAAKRRKMLQFAAKRRNSLQNAAKRRKTPQNAANAAIRPNSPQFAAIGRNSLQNATIRCKIGKFVLLTVIDYNTFASIAPPPAQKRGIRHVVEISVGLVLSSMPFPHPLRPLPSPILDSTEVIHTVYGHCKCTVTRLHHYTAPSPAPNMELGM